MHDAKDRGLRRVSWKPPGGLRQRRTVMFLRKKKVILRSNGPGRLPSYVRNVNSAQCLFCPYGT
ncbi:MAG: hypothetical protein ACRETA_12335, partial [Gammaproteobacteria bacterium]